MTEFEDRFRRILWDLTDRAPVGPDRTAMVHRGIARRRRIRVAGTAGVVVAVLASMSAGLVTLGPLGHHTPPAPAGVATGAPSHAALRGAQNLLLVGEDGAGHADSITILHLAADHRTAYLVSIPRDTYVHIPAYDNGVTRYAGGDDKITAATAYGAQGLTGAAARQHGTDLLVKTITALYGITINAAASADYTGLEQVINAVGGVDLYVDEKTTSIHVGYDKAGNLKAPFADVDGLPSRPVPGVTPVVYNVGNQHLTGWQAVDYVRQRDLLANGDGDYGRQRHQEQLLIALYRRVTSGAVRTDPNRLAGLLTTLGKALTIDTGGAPLADWVLTVRDLPAGGLVGIKTNDGKFDVYQPRPGFEAERLNDTSKQLLDAVRTDAVGQFVAAHRDWVVGEP